MSSEKTAAAEGAVGELRFDPFAMLPFCGYHMGDYMAHWLKIGRREGAQLPRLFYVNWFRKDEAGERILWPGFGENSRVLEWVFRRCDDAVEADRTALGLVPRQADLNTDGLDIDPADLVTVLDVDDDELRQQLPQMEEHLDRFGDRLPDEVRKQMGALRERLGAS